MPEERRLPVITIDLRTETRDADERKGNQELLAQAITNSEEVFEIEPDQGCQDESAPNAAGNINGPDGKVRYVSDGGADHIPEVVIPHARWMLVVIERIRRRDSSAKDALRPVDPRCMIEDRETPGREFYASL